MLTVPLNPIDSGLQRLAFTPGEPAGIGPDLAVLLASQPRDFELITVASRSLLEARAQQLGVALVLRDFDPGSNAQADRAGELCILDTALGAPVSCGEPHTDNAHYVLDCLANAVDLCVDGTCSGLVTGPIQKSIINDAGIAFSGHTEFIADRTNSHPVMMLAAGNFRVALATTHLPLSQVAAAITEASLLRTCRTLYRDLRLRFGIAQPHVLVCGLNPHAGEGGHLGDEELRVITPVLDQLIAEGLSFAGPLPADTLFTPRHLDTADAVLAMFHDQGLPVLKYAGFGSAVNVTLGLPIIRTSVDHGTALDLAGTGRIETGSLDAAIDLALILGQHEAARHSA